MKKSIIPRLLCLLPLPAALVFNLWARAHPQEVERLVTTGFYPGTAAQIGRLMSEVSFPVVEIAAILLLLFLLISLLSRRFFRVFAILLLIPAVFLAGWGLYYHRLPLETILDLPIQASTAQELTTLCQTLVADANAHYSEPPEDPLARVPDALDAAAIHWPAIPCEGYPIPKYALSSPLLSRLLIEGFTSPFTLEALVNWEIPMMSIPFTASHEAAHVRGFAREEDASLIAYLACAASDEPYFRYSGSVSALLYALDALAGADSAAYERCRAALRSEVQQDLADHAAFWAPLKETRAAQIATEVNDTYLQVASGGEEGVRSYGRLVDLLLALQRKEALS